MEMDDGGFGVRQFGVPEFGGFCVVDKNRSAVAHPAAIGRMHDEPDIFQITARALEITARQFLLGLVPDENAHEFARRNLAHHLAIDPADGLHFARPIGS